MSNVHLHNITNSFLDVRLVSLKSWRRANEIVPRDNGGPYVVLQEGYDPEDLTMTPDEFVLGRSGKWLSLGFFFKLAVPERREEFVFGTAAEVMRMLSELSANVAILSHPADLAKASAIAAEDEMAVAFQAQKSRAGGT
jgi:hypothetical protein